MHFYCEKLLAARNQDRGWGLNRPLGTENVKHTGVENLAGGVQLPNSLSSTRTLNSRVHAVF